MRLSFTAVCVLVAAQAVTTTAAVAASAATAGAATAAAAATATATATAAAAAAATATPAAGAIHLCLAPPSAQMPGVSSDDATAAVRDVFKSYLAGPSLAVDTLAARLTSQAREEAKQKHCRYVLYTTVAQERKTSSGLFGRIAAGALQSGASQVAANSGSAGTRVLASATAGGAASTYYSSFTQSSDKLTLTARLEAADGKLVVENTEKRKANSDGEDLLSPLVERAAEKMVSAMTGAKP
ncbi:MAG: hypothetical protein WDO68_04525 [Gammaproteobacteria bacterium]